jgi:hypothetical protein
MSCAWLAWPITALLGLFSPAPTTDYTRMVDRASASVVRLTSVVDTGAVVRHGLCSGIAVAKQRVLTAAHCVDGHSSIMVDGFPVAEILRTSAYYDLAWLNVPMMSKAPLVLRDDPVVRFEELTAIGYGYGWSRLSVRPQLAFLIGISIDDGEATLTHAPGIVMQGGFAGGMSGGPIVDRDGHLVSIVQMGVENVGIGATVLNIRAFLQGLL